MILFEKEFLKELMTAQEPPCLSLYQPTHRMHPDNQQDPIRFGNLVKELEQSLATKFPEEKIRQLLEPFELMAGDRDLWNHTLEGLVVLRSPAIFRIYGLQRSVPELAIVADSFHTKPLQRYVQTADRYQVLGLSLNAVTLYEGNRYVLDKIDLPREVPATIEEALGSELTDPHLTVATYGGTTAQGTNMVHGHGGKKDEMDVDSERFFRTVDRAVHEHCSRPSGLPLMLAALPEHHNLFQKVSRNPFLLKNGIRINPESQSDEALRKAAWEVWEPQFQQKLSDLSDKYKLAEATSMGTTDIREAAKAAAAGRVDKLLIEEGKLVPGKISVENGSIEEGDLADPGVDDLLDDLGALVIDRGGEVIVLPSEKIPSETGLAAIYRYRAG